MIYYLNLGKLGFQFSVNKFHILMIVDKHCVQCKTECAFIYNVFFMEISNCYANDSPSKRQLRNNSELVFLGEEVQETFIL